MTKDEIIALFSQVKNTQNISIAYINDLLFHWGIEPNISLDENNNVSYTISIDKLVKKEIPKKDLELIKEGGGYCENNNLIKIKI